MRAFGSAKAIAGPACVLVRADVGVLVVLFVLMSLTLTDTLTDTFPDDYLGEKSSRSQS